MTTAEKIAAWELILITLTATGDFPGLCAVIRLLKRLCEYGKQPWLLKEIEDEIKQDTENEGYLFFTGSCFKRSIYMFKPYEIEPRRAYIENKIAELKKQLNHDTE